MRTKKYRKNRRKDSPEDRRAKRIARLMRFLKAAALISTVSCMSALFIFCHDFLTQCDFFKAREIKVYGIQRLSEEQIIEHTGLGFGMNILSINLSLVRKKLLANPWIKDARVGREVPDTLFVRIIEQDPAAVLELGAKFLMNRSGEIFKAWEPSDPAGLPLVSGLFFSDLRTVGQEGSVRFLSVMEVLKLGGEPGSIFPNELIRRIHVDPHMGVSLTTAMRERTIRLGFDDFPEKYSLLRKVFFHMESREIFTDFNSIDVTNPESIVVYPVKNEDQAIEIKRRASKNKEA